MFNQSLLRARMLLQQNRVEEAEQSLKQVLADNPEDAEAFALLALCKSNQGQKEEAINLIQRALNYEADNPSFLYFYSSILFAQSNYKEANKIIQIAISIYPEEATFYGILSNIYLAQKEWEAALSTAEKGLSLNAEDLTCLNSRTTALLKLNHKEEAFETIKEALHHNPENAYTHANLAWGLLEKGNHTKGLEHFRKALQIDPTMEMAKAGLVEGLKARYWVYRIFLKYAFWVGNLKKNAQWAMIIGLYMAIWILQTISDYNPAIKPLILPFIALYFLFAFTTWVIGPLSNLFLRFNVYGRYALSKEEITSSTFVGCAMLIGLLSGLAYLATSNTGFATLGIVGLSLMIPFSGTFAIPFEKKRKKVLIFTFLLLTLGLFAAFQSFAVQVIFPPAMLLYIVGVVVFQWVANFLVTKA